MNPFLKKEIRLLLPTSVAALLVAFSTLLLSTVPNYYSGFRAAITVLPYILSPALVLMMALDSFGREISAGTFSQLLAQPICRKKIWRTKTLLLCAATVLVWLVWWSCYVGNKNISLKPDEMRDTLLTALLVPLVIFSGALWTVLLLRQVAAAFWFTLIIPAALALVTTALAEKFLVSVAAMIATVLSIYSIAGIIFARWLFLRAQDVQWTGGVIALPEIPSLRKSRIPAIQRLRHPRTALLFKEIQLHQSQLVMAGVLLLFHLVVIFIRKFVGTFGSPALEFVYQNFWVLWFAMPLLIGCAAVAEERKLGTLGTQFCLPVPRRTQFRIKLFTVLFLSLLMAILVPWLIEGDRIFPLNNTQFVEDVLSGKIPSRGTQTVYLLFFLVAQCIRFSPFLTLVGIALGITAISFYASSFSRNTLQSLAPAILGIVIGQMLLVSAAHIDQIVDFELWHGWLIFFLGVPIMAATLRILMFSNFKDVFVSRKIWLRNGVTVVVSLAFVVGITTFVYHRGWELLMPLESPHGTSRLSSQQVKMQAHGDSLTIQLADGKVLTEILKFNEPDLGSVLFGNWKLDPLSEVKSLEGNWSDVTISSVGTIGIRTDGTLWASEKPRSKNEKEPAKLVQLGQDRDWKSVVGYHPYDVFLLKTNGTLWHVGVHWNRNKEPWPGIKAFPPQQLGTNSDWVEISRMNFKTIFRDEKGQSWIYPQSAEADTNNMIKFNKSISVYRADYLDEMKSVTTAWSPRSLTGNFQVGVRDDGTLLVNASWGKLPRGRFGIWGFAKQDIPLDKKSDWLAVAGRGEIAALEADGSLWKWTFLQNPVTSPASARKTRLGKYSDWIALAGEFDVAALVADGSIWYWQNDDYRYDSDDSIQPLLAPSRKPQKIGNVFDALNVSVK